MWTLLYCFESSEFWIVPGEACEDDFDLILPILADLGHKDARLVLRGNTLPRVYGPLRVGCRVLHIARAQDQVSFFFNTIVQHMYRRGYDSYSIMDTAIEMYGEDVSLQLVLQLRATAMLVYRTFEGCSIIYEPKTPEKGLLIKVGSESTPCRVYAPDKNLGPGGYFIVPVEMRLKARKSLDMGQIMP